MSEEPTFNGVSRAYAERATQRVLAWIEWAEDGGDTTNPGMCADDVKTALAFAAEARSHDGGWEAIETAPHACHVIAVRFDHDAGEWIYAFVKSPPSKPFTHWRMPPEPPVSAVPLFDEGPK